MVRSLLTNGGCVENAMDSSSISLSVLRSSSKTSPIPVSFVPPTTLIGYRWACLRTKYVKLDFSLFSLSKLVLLVKKTHYQYK